MYILLILIQLIDFLALLTHGVCRVGIILLGNEGVSMVAKCMETSAIHLYTAVLHTTEQIESVMYFTLLSSVCVVIHSVEMLHRCALALLILSFLFWNVRSHNNCCGDVRHTTSMNCHRLCCDRQKDLTFSCYTCLLYSLMMFQGAAGNYLPLICNLSHVCSDMLIESLQRRVTPRRGLKIFSSIICDVIKKIPKRT